MSQAHLRHEGKSHPLDGPFCSIGRDPACDICLNDQELSRKHAIIISSTDNYSLLDFKSSNGVFVNNKRIDHVILQSGDIIQMGDQIFEFVVEEEQSAAAAPAAGADFGTTTFHTMVDLERSLSQDTMMMLEKQQPATQKDAFEKLVILFQVSKVINSVLDQKEVLNKVIDLSLKVITADRGFIMLSDDKGELVPTVARQMDNMLAQDGPMTISRNIVESVRTSKKPVLTQDALIDPRFQTSGSIQMYNIRSAMCVPLLNKEEELIGVLYVDNRIQSHCFEDDDLKLLAAFADQAAIAIENSRLYTKVKTETQIRNNLSRYLSPDLVDRVIQQKSGVNLGGEKVEATILFADIRGFTTFSEKWASKDVITFLNEYLSSMTRVIFQYKGTLDKYIGDGIMAVFGAPFNPAYAPARAVLAGLHMQKEMKSLQQRWVEMGYPPMQIGIGINTGEVTAGNIGFKDEDNDARSRMDFTVIGDAVNTAARLESIAAGGQVLISQATYDQVQDRFKVEAMGEKMVKGKKKAVLTYEVLSVQ